MDPVFVMSALAVTVLAVSEPVFSAVHDGIAFNLSLIFNMEHGVTRDVHIASGECARAKFAVLNG